tara:strand:- start:1072 stop:1524 length:453 start_codon:yes stop_codon:yes gene_type:complete
MKQKLLIIITIFFFLQNCGYTPIYSDNQDKKISINIIEIGGNDDMNNIVSRSLKRYSNNSSEKIYDLKISTDFKKIALSKNKKGEITNYLIISKISFEILNDENSRVYNFEDETKIENISNQFELKKYEKSIKTNFINLKIEELILRISN